LKQASHTRAARPPDRCIIATIILACALPVVLGFAAHRASVRMMQAMAEVASSRTAQMLVSVGKSALWALAMSVPVFLQMPSARASLSGWPLTGAAINGGYAYSTISRLVDGEVGMLATCVAFGLGALCFVLLADHHWLERPAASPALLRYSVDWALAPGLVLTPLGVYEAARLWRAPPC
jgi:hypothetical protein